MAKTLYLTNAVASAHRGTNDAKLNAATSFWTAKLLSEARGATTGTTVTATVTTVAGATPGIEVGVSAIPYEWISEPLAADFTISGTITLNLWMAESSNSANAAANMAIDKVDGATGALTRIATTARTTEMPLTTPTAANFTVTPTSTACKRGDRLRVRVFADDAGTMGTGFTVTLWYDRSTAAQGESFITFTENLTFERDPGTVGFSQGDADSSTTFGTAASGRDALAQSFVAPASTLVQVTGSLADNSAADNCVIEIQSDSSGRPSGTVVATVATVSSATTTVALTDFVWPVSVTLTPTATYWLVFRRSGALATPYWQTRSSFVSPLPGWTAFYALTSGVWNVGDGTSLTVGFLFTGAATSTYYLTDTAETINPGSATEKKALTTRGSGVVAARTNTVNGPTAPIQVTDSAGGTAIEWYSPPLEAVTLGGKAKFNVWASQGTAGDRTGLKAEIAVCANNGTGATVWGIANNEAITTYGLSGELNTISRATVLWVAGDDVAVTAGQRLRFRVYHDDCGAAALIAETGGFAPRVGYNGTSAATDGDTYVILPVAVTEQAGGTTYTKSGFARESA